MDGGISLAAEKRKNIETPIHDGSCKRVKAEWQTTSEDDLTLLHLSDDVLLNIFAFCSPTDIRALSFCNKRLNVLCYDRSLWKRVDLRDRRMGVKTLSLYIRNLPKHTAQALCVRGLVGRPNLYQYQSKNNKNQNAGADIKDTPKQAEPENIDKASNQDSKNESLHSQKSLSSIPVVALDNSSSGSVKKDVDFCQPSTSGLNADNNEQETCEDDTPPNTYDVVKENGNSSPKPFSPNYNSNPTVSSPTSNTTNTIDDAKNEKNKTEKSDKTGNGENEDYTVTKDLMSVIKKKCPNLKELRLEFCYIDCNAIQSSSFPPTLETLSLRGSVCRNVPLSRAYLFRLHEHCPNLTEIDLSRCGWLASHSLLVLSKVPTLKKLSLKHCCGLGECVAYASLSARYGFKSLEVLDIRGTPMSDSEITAFSLIGSLKELLLQGSGVVEDSIITGSVGGYSSHSPSLRCRNDTGEPLSWETQYPYQCASEWGWSESEDEAENDVPQTDGGSGAGGDDQNVNFSRNAFEQMVDEGADPFEAVGRVHVIYVDVRRAPHNNILRVRYAPVHQPQGQQQQVQAEAPQQQPEADNAPPQPGFEMEIGNGFFRDGDNRINFRVQYGNNMEPPAAAPGANQGRDAGEAAQQEGQQPVHPGILHFRGVFRNLHNHDQAARGPQPDAAAGDNPQGNPIHAENRNDPMNRPNAENIPVANNANVQNNENNIANQPDNPVNVGAQRPDEHNVNAPRPLARPGEFLRRGPAFVLYPNEQQANRIIQQQQQAQVAHRQEVVPQLLYDFRHTMRQLESFVGKLRSTEQYDRYVRRVQFFRRMLQQIYSNEPVFNTARIIPEQPFASQRDVVRISRLIDTTCHHLERLIARAIQYPPDEVPFRINYNYIDNPDYVEEMAEDENDARMRPETVEFYIQRYFGVPPAEEVNADARNVEAERQPLNIPLLHIPQQLNEPVLRMMDANVPAPDELADIVNNIHNVLHNNRAENIVQIHNAEVVRNIPVPNPPNVEQEAPNQNNQQQNNEDVGRMVNIHNINIEIHEHVQQPIAPAGGNQRGEPNIDRIIDEHVERVVHDEIRAMQQEHQHRRNRNDPRAPVQDERIRIEGPFVIRGDVMEEGGRRRRRVVHIPLQLNVRGPGQPNDVSYVGTSNLITDASLLRFGHCKNIVHIGGDAQIQQQSAVRGGQLTTLVCRGYPRVTDRSLSHLAVAAPKLTRLDLSHTGVTNAGAQAFRAARQDCELIVEHLTDVENE